MSALLQTEPPEVATAARALRPGLRNVVALLGCERRHVLPTVERAVALADRESARLMLVTSMADYARWMWMTWVAVSLGAIFPAMPEPADCLAEQVLAETVKLVPAWIPVTTQVIGPNTERELRRLIDNVYCDAIVATARTLARMRALTAELHEHGISVVPVALG